MPTINLQVEVSEETFAQIVALVTGSHPAKGNGRAPRTRRAEAWQEGSPEWEGNYAHLYKDGLRPDLWEMLYRAAKRFGTTPFTIGDLAEELGVEQDEIRKRIRALGRSRVVSNILAGLGGLGGETSRDDAMPWVRIKDSDGRWAYRFWGWQEPESQADQIVALGP